MLRRIKEKTRFLRYSISEKIFFGFLFLEGLINPDNHNDFIFFSIWIRLVGTDHTRQICESDSVDIAPFLERLTRLTEKLDSSNFTFISKAYFRYCIRSIVRRVQENPDASES